MGASSFRYLRQPFGSLANATASKPGGRANPFDLLQTTWMVGLLA